MSFSIDVNLLLYASSQASPFYPRATEFLKTCARGPDLLCLTWPTVMGYLRMATHPAILSPPLSPAEAMHNVDSLLSLPHVRILTEQEGFWDLYREIAREMSVRGNFVPDAHFATLLRQHGIRVLYSNDRDFRKFDFLEVRNPFA